jgi:hypothetical protein
VLFEDVWPDRPQAGWVFGVPFREALARRAGRALPAAAASSTVRDAAAARRYLWFDAAASTYQLAECREMAAIDARRTPLPDAPGSTNADGRPWFEHGGWSAAFPYLPLARR